MMIVLFRLKMVKMIKMVARVWPKQPRKEDQKIFFPRPKKIPHQSRRRLFFPTEEFFCVKTKGKKSQIF